MCRLQNIAMGDFQESVTIGQTDGWTDRQTPDKVIPMYCYASQATQKDLVKVHVSFRMHFVLRESFGLILCYVH